MRAAQRATRSWLLQWGPAATAAAQPKAAAAPLSGPAACCSPACPLQPKVQPPELKGMMDKKLSGAHDNSDLSATGVPLLLGLDALLKPGRSMQPSCH